MWPKQHVQRLFILLHIVTQLQGVIQPYSSHSRKYQSIYLSLERRASLLKKIYLTVFDGYCLLPSLSCSAGKSEITIGTTLINLISLKIPVYSEQKQILITTSKFPLIIFETLLLFPCFSPIFSLVIFPLKISSDEGIDERMASVRI